MALKASSMETSATLNGRDNMPLTLSERLGTLYFLRALATSRRTMLEMSALTRLA